MKLISLNTWGGRYFKPLIRFIRENSQNTDIFCFQEMRHTTTNIREFAGYRANLLSEIKNILTDFQVFYFPTMKGFDNEASPANFDLTFGQAIFAKNSIKITNAGNHFIYRDENSPNINKDFSNLPVPLQYISFTIDNKELTVFNFHGSPMPGDKLDTDKRLAEANKSKDIIDKKSGAKILVGDFNLLPQTQSIKIYESNMRNLINEFNIVTTRSRLSPFYNTPDFQRYADYTFVSSDVEVKSFQVPDVAISDHLPMLLEFS